MIRWAYTKKGATTVSQAAESRARVSCSPHTPHFELFPQFLRTLFHDTADQERLALIPNCSSFCDVQEQFFYPAKTPLPLSSLGQGDAPTRLSHPRHPSFSLPLSRRSLSCQKLRDSGSAEQQWRNIIINVVSSVLNLSWNIETDMGSFNSQTALNSWLTDSF